MDKAVVRQMTVQVIEKIMLVAMWWKREDFCRHWHGCKGCPFDQSKVCDKATTEFVLESAGKLFAEYLETALDKKLDPTDLNL
jgi:hypothetical protein